VHTDSLSLIQLCAYHLCRGLNLRPWLDAPHCERLVARLNSYRGLVSRCLVSPLAAVRHGVARARRLVCSRLGVALLWGRIAGSLRPIHFPYNILRTKDRIGEADAHETRRWCDRSAAARIRPL